MRRPRVRISVRWLMISVLAIGGGLGWVVHRERVQREAVEAIRKAGGSVSYSWQYTDGTYLPPGGPGLPGWLLNALGPDHFYRATSIDLVGGRVDKINDALMARIGQLSGLERLNLNGSKGVTDAGMVHLAGLKNLRHLDLSFVDATGASLEHLKGMKRLKHLELPFGRIVDADLAHLGGLTNQKWLQLQAKAPTITDAGLAHLKGLVNLEMISFGSPGITSRGLEALHDMKRLETINIRSSGITELAPIRDLTGLTSLTLRSALGLMGVISVVATGMAALRSNDGFWAAAILTLTVLILCTSTILAMYHRGAWAGFAVFGWVMYLICQPHAAPSIGILSLPMAAAYRVVFFLSKPVSFPWVSFQMPSFPAIMADGDGEPFLGAVVGKSASFRAMVPVNSLRAGLCLLNPGFAALGALVGG